ncbi:MAG: hypothetical protein H8D67_17375 [Deltaproteobacteria bacterium]|nr:hypothetical protein [Deltaproteobacteria bacterium]
MAGLRKRGVVLTKDEEINVKNLEDISRHFDDRLRELDLRRIVQQSSLDDGATLADVISALNALNTALNSSDLTE